MNATKNGFPWCGIYDLNITASSHLMQELIKEFESTEWDNYRRLSHQTALYAGTRIKHYGFNRTNNEPSLVPIFNQAMDEIKDAFPLPMIPTYGEIASLLPNKQVHLHYDHQLQCRLSSRIVMPFLNNDDVDYYFANWNDNCPTDTFPNPYGRYSDLENPEKLKLKTGRFYVYNHRVPHWTDNMSSTRPRGLLSINLIPKDQESLLTKQNFKAMDFPKEYEKVKLQPSIIL